MKKRMDDEVTSFLPDALAIRNSRLPRWASCGILWMAAAFVLAIAWATVGRVDVIVTAPGKIISDHPTIMMKPLERTVIKSIDVAVGDRVKAGQVLATFDPVFSAADKARLESDIRIYEAQFGRLNAEYSGTGYDPGPAPTDEARWQLSLFNERQRLHKERTEYFAREIEAIERQLRSLAKNLEVQRVRLSEYREIEAMVRKALTSQSASLRTLKEIEIQRMQLESEIGDKENQQLVLQSSLLSKTAERDAFLTDWGIRTAEEMVKAREALTNARKEHEKAAQMTSYVALRAPEDAVVHEVAPVSIGSAVREAEAVVTLVPTGGTLEVEAEIRAEDIGRVHCGDEVRVKVSAFPFQTYGTLHGSVRVISEDAFSRTAENAREGMAPSATFYRARVALSAERNAGSSIPKRLIPGMETQCEIVSGTRRIIRYLVNPIVKSLDEAIREP